MRHYVAVFIFLLSSCASTKKVETLIAPEIFANLGDGINTDHFFPIPEYLAKQNSTLKQKEDFEKNYKSSVLKGEKAKVSRFMSSEFSHLVKAIAQSNKLQAAAVYDRFGLAVGYSDEKNRLPLFSEKALTKKYISLENVYFEKIDADSYKAIRPIRSAEDERVVGFSVVVFDTAKFQIPTL